MEQEASNEVAASGDNWRDSLPAELRDNPSLSDVNDIASLAKRFIDTKAMVGNSVRMPTDDAGDEDINAFVDKILANETVPLMRKPDPANEDAMKAVYDALGRPEDAGGYAAAEGMDAEFFGAMAAEAHKLGLSKSQFEGLAAAQHQAQSAVMQQHVEQREASLGQLRGEWGPAFEEKSARAAQVAEAMKAPEGLVNALKSGQIDGDTLRFLDNVATQLGGEGSQIAQQISKVNAMTVDELEQRRAEVQSRMFSEDLTSTQQQALQRKLVEYSEQILAARRG